MPHAQPSKDRDASSKVIKLLEELSCSLSPNDAAKLNVKSSDPKEYEFAEHKHLGDSITLKGHDETPFTLRKNLSLTYGQINGLAGDFFGTVKPICLGTTDQDRQQRFRDAYHTLVDENSDANSLIKKLEAEVDSLKKAKEQQDKKQGVFSENYKPTAWIWLQLATMRAFGDNLSYLRLGAINLDHFGQDARTAYSTGHRVALLHAAKASPKMASDKRQKFLVEAYTMNAFADHFLEDQFASGHLRTPRRQLLDSVIGANWASLDDQAKNLCAKAMHDEDNKKGLLVRSPNRSDTWKVLGDGHLLDSENHDALEQATKALQASADEVYEAWKNGTIPQDKDFKPWFYAPTLESANGIDNFPPLFNQEGKVRKPLDGTSWDSVTYVRVEDWNDVRRTVNPQPVDPLIHAKASGAAYEVKDSWGDKHEFLGANAGATLGTYVGVDAGIHAYKYESDGAKLKIGLGVDTGAGFQNGSAELKVFGSGISIGRETGFSFFGSEFKCKLW